MIDKLLSGKKIAIILAFRDFNDAEYFGVKEALQNAGATIITASDSVGIAIGDDGGEAPIGELSNRLVVDDFEAIVFIGGRGMAKKIEEPDLQKIARQTILQDKVLAAICCSPAILARAGVLRDKKATVWSGALDKSLIKILKEEGAIYKNESVVIDGRIVTANGPEAAQDLAVSIIDAIRLKGYNQI